MKRTASSQAASSPVDRGRLVIFPPEDQRAHLFFALGQPVPQPRASVTVRCGFGVAYVPAGHSIHAWRAEVERSASEEIQKTIEGTVALAMEVIVSRPKGHWTTRGELSAAGRRSEEPPGDWDNFVKAIQDAIVRAAAITDDRKVVGPNVAWKRWAARGETPGALVWIAPADAVRCVWGAVP